MRAGLSELVLPSGEGREAQIPDAWVCGPGGGYTWTEAVVLIGRWTDGIGIEWDLSERVAIEPDKSTCGLMEPTVAEMPDGRMLMVMRASNDAEPEIEYPES